MATLITSLPDRVANLTHGRLLNAALAPDAFNQAAIAQVEFWYPMAMSYRASETDMRNWPLQVTSLVGEIRSESTQQILSFAVLILEKFAIVGQHKVVAASILNACSTSSSLDATRAASKLLAMDGVALERVVEQLLLQGTESKHARVAVCHLIAANLKQIGGLKYLLTTKFTIVRG